MLVDFGVQAYFGVTLRDESGIPLGIAVLLHSSPVSTEKARSMGALLRLLQPRIEAEMRYRRAMDMMQVIASSALSSGGTLEQLVASLAQVTHMKCAYVALHVQKGGHKKIETLVTIVQGELYTGPVVPSSCPCEQVQIGRPVRISENVLDTFSGEFLEAMNAQAYFAMAISDLEGNLLGHVGLVHDRPVHADIFSLPLFQVIVARLGAELCQQVALKKRAVLERRLAKRQHHEGLGVLAGGIAHDFNNLLVAIGGPAEIIRLTHSGDKSINDNVETILDATQQAAGLCKQLLRYAGHKPADKTSFNLNEVISQSQRIASMYTSNNSVLEYQLAAEALPVYGNDIEMQQAIMNLIKNAADATTDGGKITIETQLQVRSADSFAKAIVGANSSPGTYAVVRVSDSGRGMSGDDLGRVFERFFTTKDSGSGIGLSVVISSVEEHGGVLEVESTLGEGTSFTISLPSNRQSESMENSKPGLKASDELGPWVLVIDDDPLVRKVLKTVLGHLGLHARLASGGAEGIALFEEHHSTISFVLLDFTMPRMTGDRVLVELRKIDSTIPVALVSGNVNADTLGSFPEAPDDFLPKPFSKQELGQMLEKHGVEVSTLGV